MRGMIRTSLALTLGIFLNATVAFAEIPSVAVHAALSFFAAQFSEAKNYQELANLIKLSSHDQKMFIRDMMELDRKKQSVPKIKVISSSLVFEEPLGKKITLDFKLASQQVVLVNGKKVKLESPLSYSKAKILLGSVIADANSLPSLSNSFLPFAFAQATTSHSVAAGMLAGSALSTLFLKPNSDVNVADAIVSTYKNEAEWAKRTAQGPGPSLKTMVFKCSGNQLDSVFYTSVVDKGALKNVQSNDMSYNVVGPQILLTFHTLKRIICSANQDGVMISDVKGCPKKGEKIHEEAPFFSFPLVAKRCCETAGCFEKVTASADTIWKDLQVSPVSPSNSYENSGSNR